MTPSDRKPSDEEVRDELDRIIRSRCFAAHEKHRNALTCLVVWTLAGHTHKEIEAKLAKQFFDVPSVSRMRIAKGDYTSPRVTKSRVKKKLAEYYLDEGQDDAVRIEIRAKTYQVGFILIASKMPPPLPVPETVTPSEAAVVPMTESLWVASRPYIPMPIVEYQEVYNLVIVHGQPRRKGRVSTDCKVFLSEDEYWFARDLVFRQAERLNASLAKTDSDTERMYLEIEKGRADQLKVWFVSYGRKYGLTRSK